MHTIEHYHVEPEPESQAEQAPARATNLELIQGTPRCIPSPSLTFIFEPLLYNKLDCALRL
jgi:hypothetical protein